MQDCTRACNVLNVLIMYLQVVFPGFGCCGLFWTCLIFCWGKSLLAAWCSPDVWECAPEGGLQRVVRTWRNRVECIVRIVDVFLQIIELKLTQAAQQRAWAWQFWEVCVLLRSVRFGFWIGLQDLQESFVWCCHPLLGDELQVWGVDRLVLFSWKIAGKLWNQQGERRSNILNDLFCVCLKTHIPSFWNPAKSAFWSFAGHRYKYMDLPLPASGTTMQWWPQTCRGNPFSESSQPFSTTSSSRVSKKSIIDLKDRLLRLIHASLDANLQSSILL